MNQLKNIRTFDGNSPQLGKGSFVDPSAVVTGKVILGDDASVWPNVSIRGDLMPITIGDGTNVQDNCVIHTSHQSEFYQAAACTVGKEVTIGHGAILHGCTIQNQVLIGMHGIVLDQVVIESKVIVAAGALVPPGKTLESGYLYVGSPAKQARALTTQELEYFHYSSKAYIKLKNAHVESLKCS